MFVNRDRIYSQRAQRCAHYTLGILQRFPLQNRLSVYSVTDLAHKAEMKKNEPKRKSLCVPDKILCLLTCVLATQSL